jgi:hypothetical protein
MTPSDSQNLESFVPVYDTVPEKWEEGRQFLVEHLKKISNAVNIRTIGWYLDEELLSGNAFIPALPVPNNNSVPQQPRQILRKTFNGGALVIGVNAPISHGIVFDANFTLIDLWVAGTNSGTLTARVINGNDVLMNNASFVITSPQAFDRSVIVCEYIQEV